MIDGGTLVVEQGGSMKLRHETAWWVIRTIQATIVGLALAGLHMGSVLAEAGKVGM